jgi:hypothetical protein
MKRGKREKKQPQKKRSKETKIFLLKKKILKKSTFLPLKYIIIVVKL